MARLQRLVDTVRALGAAATVWSFLTSQLAALYVWGPVLTAWAFIAGWLEGISTPYLLAACSLTFGAVIWCFLKGADALDRFRERYEKIGVSFDRNIPSCRADVTFADGSHSMCFRLKVENKTTSKLHGCEGWLESTDRFPNISPVKLFWVGSPKEPMFVDLIKRVPRFLQVCRIHSSNQIIMATENEVWPIDSISAFHPGVYVFKIGLKGEDRAETTFYSVRLNWTGNWTTAEMNPYVG